MPSDGKGQGSGEGPRPDPNSGPASKPDPAGGPEVEKGGPQHVICMPPAEEEEKVSVTSAAAAAAAAAKKSCLSRSNSCQEECRICQQPSEELLIVLGCKCRGGLAKAHRSCVEVWFRTKGSNKCEICQQVAANVAPPESQQSTNYWVWRVDSAGGTNIGRGNHERQCFSPLWVAFAILIGGLLLDVLISISLGVSALPVNIIIGVLIVLGLGTAFRLVLECCQAWGSRRNAHVQRVDTIHGSHPAL